MALVDQLTIKQDPEDRQMYHLRYIQPGTRNTTILFASTHIDCLIDLLPTEVLEDLENGAPLSVQLRVVENG